MTAVEKAKELTDSFYQLFPLKKEVITSIGELNWEYDNWEQAKKAALIAVEEVMYQLTVLPYGMEYLSHINYWEEVKEEIKKL